jgi:hypothetical protein
MVARRRVRHFFCFFSLNNTETAILRTPSGHAEASPVPHFGMRRFSGCFPDESRKKRKLPDENQEGPNR